MPYSKKEYAPVINGFATFNDGAIYRVGKGVEVVIRNVPFTPEEYEALLGDPTYCHGGPDCTCFEAEWVEGEDWDDDW
jgi:hypothetical protein